MGNPSSGYPERVCRTKTLPAAVTTAQLNISCSGPFQFFDLPIDHGRLYHEVLAQSRGLFAAPAGDVCLILHFPDKW